MKERTSKHVTVLLKETIDLLALSKGKTLVNATLGGGGIERELAKRHAEGVNVISLDADLAAVSRAKKEFSGKTNLQFFCENFRNLDRVLRKTGVSQANAILFDLGLSTDQLESSGRGFSFLRDEPLRMTFSARSVKGQLTARKIVNSWSEKEIADTLFTLGEETRSRRIAQAIVESRKKKPITTSGELASLIVSVSPRASRIHPATKTFQALRIAVNGELTALQEGLSKAWDALSGGGRMAVLSFHSIEDRIVKNFFRSQVFARKGTLVTKKPIVPSRKEQKENPRSRSVKLRGIQKNRHHE